MPVYEYKCNECDHEFEELVFGAERPECPRCKRKNLHKRVSSFGVGEAAATAAPSPAPALAPGACGTCGNPAGPGSC